MTWKTPFPLISVTVWLESLPPRRARDLAPWLLPARRKHSGGGWHPRALRPLFPAGSQPHASGTRLSGRLFGWRGPGTVPSGWEARRGWLQTERFYRLPASPSPFPFLCSCFDNRPEISVHFLRFSPRPGSPRPLQGQGALGIRRQVRAHTPFPPSSRPRCEQQSEPALACSPSVRGGRPHRERLPPDRRPGLSLAFSSEGARLGLGVGNQLVEADIHHTSGPHFFLP